MTLSERDSLSLPHAEAVEHFKGHSVVRAAVWGYQEERASCDPLTRDSDSRASVFWKILRDWLWMAISQL